ncbi:MAG: hypothetical protein ACREJ3_08735 [Polyangiaceae bacterium]
MPDGKCARCAGDADCVGVPSGGACAPSGQCVGCLTDKQCPASLPRCDPGAQQCVRCLSNQDCLDAFCNLTTYTCVTQ